MFRGKGCVVTVTGDITFADRHSFRETVIAIEPLQQIWSFGKRSAPEFRDFRVETLMQHPHASPFMKVLQGGKAVAMAEEWVLAFQKPNAAFRVGLPVVLVAFGVRRVDVAPFLATIVADPSVL